MLISNFVASELNEFLIHVEDNLSDPNKVLVDLLGEDFFKFKLSNFNLVLNDGTSSSESGESDSDIPKKPSLHLKGKNLEATDPLEVDNLKISPKKLPASDLTNWGGSNEAGPSNLNINEPSSNSSSSPQKDKTTLAIKKSLLKHNRETLSIVLADFDAETFESKGLSHELVAVNDRSAVIRVGTNLYQIKYHDLHNHIRAARFLWGDEAHIGRYRDI